MSRLRFAVFAHAAVDCDTFRIHGTIHFACEWLRRQVVRPRIQQFSNGENRKQLTDTANTPRTKRDIVIHSELFCWHERHIAIWLNVFPFDNWTLTRMSHLSPSFSSDAHAPASIYLHKINYQVNEANARSTRIITCHSMCVSFSHRLAFTFDMAGCRNRCIAKHS